MATLTADFETNSRVLLEKRDRQNFEKKRRSVQWWILAKILIDKSSS